MLILLFLVVWQFLSKQGEQDRHLLFSTFVSDVEQHPEKFKASAAIQIRKNQDSAELKGQYTTGETFVTTGIVGDKLLEKLDKAHLNYEVVKDSENNFWQQVFVTWLPMLVLVVLFLVFMRQLQVGGGKAMSFGKSKAKLLSENQRKITFADVAGIEEAKDEVEEIIAFLKDPKKFTRLGGGHDERKQTLNQLLVEMDGFESNDGVILIAATNRPDVLDPALLRPGRFDRRVVVDRPDLRGREQILKVHTRNTPLAENVDLSVIARGTPGFSGADLANLVNEAALNAARFNKKKVEMIDFEYAKDKVMMGPERKSMIMTEEEKRNTAYHEGGHALVAALLPDADPVHKVTIIPRGRALGVTMQLPAEDKYSHTREYLEATITVMMGGRIAEERFLGHMTTGAGNDIEKATDLARKMVCEWGMSDLGPLTFGKPEQEIFLGRDFGRTQDYSESTANQIDAEVKRIVMTAYAHAKKLIDEHQKAMHRIARTLLEKEVLDGDEVLQIIADESGLDVAKLRKTGPPKPPILPGATPEIADGSIGPLVPEPA